MLRQNSTNIKSEVSGQVDIQGQLNRLEEIILDRPRILFILVDEKQLLEPLEIVHLNLEGH
ncbi:hypothetical protein [Okeania sp. KiyG1]|uniref:hypothetical protein n=1 Tax=Okeania sp. KiyG1 TaxID=2720165 RepID=UPI001922D599|nr:hypothetical protein [Okeania sp. KiyG1]GGA34859.1 hypothetical protein CYANOKiyG1_52320 [Okeania sp. KiyG1]